MGNQPGARSGIGWNMGYPFNVGDLLCCGQLAANYLDNSSKVPWEDLRYLCGSVMYGGHIGASGHGGCRLGCCWSQRMACYWMQGVSCIS